MNTQISENLATQNGWREKNNVDGLSRIRKSLYSNVRLWWNSDEKLRLGLSTCRCTRCEKKNCPNNLNLLIIRNTWRKSIRTIPTTQLKVFDAQFCGRLCRFLLSVRLSLASRESLDNFAAQIAPVAPLHPRSHEQQFQLLPIHIIRATASISGRGICVCSAVEHERATAHFGKLSIHIAYHCLQFSLPSHSWFAPIYVLLCDFELFALSPMPRNGCKNDFQIDCHFLSASVAIVVSMFSLFLAFFFFFFISPGLFSFAFCHKRLCHSSWPCFAFRKLQSVSSGPSRSSISQFQWNDNDNDARKKYWMSGRRQIRTDRISKTNGNKYEWIFESSAMQRAVENVNSHLLADVCAPQWSKLMAWNAIIGLGKKKSMNKMINKIVDAVFMSRWFPLSCLRNHEITANGIKSTLCVALNECRLARRWMLRMSRLTCQRLQLTERYGAYRLNDGEQWTNWQRSTDTYRTEIFRK